jgi:hypothetical protein
MAILRRCPSRPTTITFAPPATTLTNLHLAWKDGDTTIENDFVNAK